MKAHKDKQRERLINFDSLDQQSKDLFLETFEEYDQYSIYKLREVARRMGVKSATTMDKRTLVTVMTELRVASTVYYPPEASKVSPVTYIDVEDINNDYLMRTLVVCPERRNGILDITPEGAWLRTKGFESDDSDVFVPMLMVNELKLLSGDEISGLARFMDRCGRFGMFKPETINGQPAEDYQRKQLSGAIAPAEIIRLGKGTRSFNALNTTCPFCKGQRKLIIGMEAFKLDSLAKEISQKLSEAGFETLNIFLDESPEKTEECEGLDGINMIIPCDRFDSYDKSVLLAVNYAKRIAPYGRNIAIVLNNADVLSESTLRSVFGVGRLTQEGSITTVIISSGLELNPVINRLTRTASSVTIFKNNFSDEPMIDVRRSFSESEALLERVEIQTLKDCRKQLTEQYVNVKDFMGAYEILLADNKEQK